MQNGLNWCNYCKSSCHEVISELFAKNAPDPPQWTLNSCFVAFRSVGCIWGHFVHHETRCKMAETCAINAKVWATKSRRIFRNACTRLNPWDPKLMFWNVS